MSNIQFKSPKDDGDNRKLRKEFTSHLSERLKEVRKSKKMTQQELAEKAGLHLTYVGHLELGKYHPTVFVMWKIAKALDVSMNELTNL
ncbi:MAG: helix-turn-helix transcriptional regulator [Candidatus Levybacteria bacterium]|nr:helix-turn-helix transcriptional regulator [Candidatus Levybacteria bacterium]